MKNIFHLLSLSLILTSCGLNSNDKIGICCDKTYTNVDSAINCLGRTVDYNGITSDSRLLLIAFVDKDLEANQMLGWNIIKDPDITKTAKRNYALVILDFNQNKILNNRCTSYTVESFKKYKGKTFFVIANQALCVFGDWTLDDKKENIIERLQIGSGP